MEIAQVGFALGREPEEQAGRWLCGAYKPQPKFTVLYFCWFVFLLEGSRREQDKAWSLCGFTLGIVASSKAVLLHLNTQEMSAKTFGF